MGLVGSYEVVGKSSIKTENSQMASIGAIFSFTYYTKQINLWPTLPASCVVIYSCPSTCPGEMQPFKDHLSTCGHWQDSETCHSKSNLGSFQYKYLPELLLLCMWKPAFIKSSQISPSCCPRSLVLWFIVMMHALKTLCIWVVVLSKVCSFIHHNPIPVYKPILSLSVTRHAT